MILRLIRIAALAVSLGGCHLIQRKPPEPVNTPELPVGNDEAFDSLMVDLQKVDTTIVIDPRYATANNLRVRRFRERGQPSFSPR